MHNCLFVYRHVGRLTDLGAILSQTGKNIGRLLAGYWRGLRTGICLGIDTYGDLLLLGHRSFAQIALGASNESPRVASAVEQVAGRPPSAPGGGQEACLSGAVRENFDTKIFGHSFFRFFQNCSVDS